MDNKNYQQHVYNHIQNHLLRDRPPIFGGNNGPSGSLEFEEDKEYSGLNLSLDSGSQINEHFLHSGPPSVGYNQQMTPIPLMNDRGASRSPQKEHHDERLLNVMDDDESSSESETRDDKVSKSTESPFTALTSQISPSPEKKAERSNSIGDDSSKAFVCVQCPKRFSQKSGLLQHQRRHIGNRPFQCSTPNCEKRFTQKSGLIQHERCHTGLRPYKCTKCDKAFTQKSGVDQHIRTHTGEKPYKCLVCAKCFTQLSGLKQHGKVHNRISSTPSQDLP